MSIDLTRRDTVQTFIDTMVIEAGSFLGKTKSDAPETSNAALRPYTRDMRSMAASAATAVAGGVVMGSPKSEKKEDQKPKNTFSLANLVASITAAFHLRSQAHKASQSLEISTRYHTAALHLNGGYHKELTFNLPNNPIAQVSKKIWELATRTKEMDGMRNSEATQYLSCGYATLMSLTTLSIGVFAPNPKVVKIGLFFLAVTGLVFLCAKLSHSGDQKKITGHYEFIGKTGEEIRRDLCFYNDSMQLQLGGGTEYKSLFDTFVQDHRHAPITDDLTRIGYPLPAAK